MSFLSLQDLREEEKEQFINALIGKKTPDPITYKEWIQLCLLELEVVPPLDEETFIALQNSLHKDA